MNPSPEFYPTLFQGWHAFQNALITAIAPLDDEQLALRAAPNLRSVNHLVRHMIGARARWFYDMFEPTGSNLKTLRDWDHRGARARSSAELQDGLEISWQGMVVEIERWSPEDWSQTWPGEPAGEPEIITPSWVIWHVLEHDLYHGGEISLTLGIQHIPAVGL